MMKARHRIALFVIALAAVASVAGQDNLTLSERVERLERQVQGGSGGGTADLIMKVNELEQEVRELRGLVEQQQHEIESLKARQRDQYLDLDRRLQGLSSSPPPTRDQGEPAPAGDREESPTPVQSPQSVPGREAEPPARTGDSGRTSEDAGRSGAAPVADEVDRQRAYDQAFAQLRDGRYANAAEAFRAFLDQYPDGPLADNAQYWLGESYYVTGNFDIALNAFQAVLSQFPQSPKAPDAHLKLGFCYYELEQWDQARESLNEVTRNYPESAVARLAENRLRLMRIEGH